MSHFVFICLPCEVICEQQICHKLMKSAALTETHPTHPSSVSVRLCFERGRRSEFDPAVSQLCQVLEHKYDFLGKQEGTKIITIAVSLFMGHWGRSEETNFSYCFDMYGLLVICFQHCNTECNQLIAVQRLSSQEIYHSQSSTTLIERKTFQVSISDMSP